MLINVFKITRASESLVISYVRNILENIKLGSYSTNYYPTVNVFITVNIDGIIYLVKVFTQ